MQEEIKEELQKIKMYTLLLAKNYLNVDDVEAYTGVSKPVIYRLMRAKRIPFSKPNGKLAFFKKSDIDAWLGSNRIASANEIEEQAASYCVNHK